MATIPESVMHPFIIKRKVREPPQTYACFSVIDTHIMLQQSASETATSTTYTTTKSLSCQNIMMHVSFEMSLT